MPKDLLGSKLGNVHHGAMFGQGFVRAGHRIVGVEIMDGIVGRPAKVGVAISHTDHPSLLEGIQQGQLTCNVVAELRFDGSAGFIGSERTDRYSNEMDPLEIACALTAAVAAPVQ